MLVIEHDSANSPQTPMPNWAMDPDVLRAIYYAIERIRSGPRRTKRERKIFSNETLPFETYTHCEITPFQLSVQQGHWSLRQNTAFYLHLTAEGEAEGWGVRLYADLSVFTGIPFGDYDYLPVVNAARVKWQAIVTWMNKVRPYGWHWLEQHVIRTCAPDGAGRKRDREAFESECS